MTHNVKLGVTIYSFAKEYYTRKYSLEDCLQKTVDLGLNGFEMVGAQMVPGYPWPSERFIYEFRELCDKYKLSLVAYGSNMDRGMRSDRDLNDDEKFQYTVNDIIYANKLGAKVMRAQYLVSPRVIERIAPYAEKYEVKVGIEMHSPESPGTPMMLEYYDTFEKVASPYIGFVPDFGSFADRPNKFVVEEHFRQGANPGIVEFMTEARYNDQPRAAVEEQIKKMGAGPADYSLLNGFYSFTAFKKPDFDGLKRMMPHVVHFHGKFYAFDENGNDVCIPLEQMLPIIRDSGFDGYIVSEYEGLDPKVDTFDLLRKHIAVERRILES